ncbi:probable serine/threonine-protein kinase pats1 [Patella vulgata]|uniref:probable serine/threonine-protein kinase pats1 n=1 Tax=Patella vulgata TaxID=6465 RepID=UPI0024A8E4A6|nr:probable serine/threonine-protein kinase pats1 [Patella vulgata]
MYTSLCHIYTEFYGELKMSNLFINQQQDNLEANISQIKHIVDVETMKKPSDHALIKLPNDYYVCNAHLLSQQGYFQDKVNEATMDFKHYDPYSKVVNTFARRGMIIKKIPDEFFNKLSNLQILHLSKCKLLEVIPDGLSKSLQLKTLTLVNLPKIKSLPSDIFMSPSLEYLEISQVPVKIIPSKFLETSKLTVLILRSMGLTSIPHEIGNLSQLNTLILNYNPITDLPMSLGKLRNLTDLDIDGMSLLEYESGFSADDLMKWFHTKASFYVDYLGEEVVQTLFEKFDINNSGTLDVNEVANLNNYLFWQVPRLGSNNINNEEYGGIPPCVFLLMSLEHLSLKNQAITAVPVHMCRLTNLANLDLASDPLLESLPGALGHLPNIKSINLFRCPSLRTPPNEVVQRGFESVQAYLKRLAGGFTECRRTKLMLVGLGGAGKTSLLKAIMSVNNKTVGTKGEQITDGIDIQPWTIKNKDNIEVTYSTWDFAGQTLYYNTHQFFLSKRAIYVLVWSTRQGFEHAGLDFWLSSISCHAPKTPIFIVGSHCDQVPKADIAMNELRKLYPQIIDFYFVSSITGTNIKQLKDDMLRVTLEQKNMGEKIPKVWLNLEKKFLE